MWTASRIIGNLRLAVGAHTRLRFWRRLRRKLVDLANHHKDNEGKNKKVDYRIHKAAVGEDGSTGFFGCLKRCVFLAVETDEQIAEINIAQQHTDRRHNNIIYDGGDDFAKSAADDNADSHIHDVAAHSKFFKIFCERYSTTPCQFFSPYIFYFSSKNPAA